MSPEDRAHGDAAIRVTIAVSCFFLVYGVTLPYLAQWLEDERGLDGAAIGAVLSISQIARLATGPSIALWAEQTGDRRTVLRALVLAGLAANAVFFFVAHGFWALLISAFLALTLVQAATPFVESAVLRVTQKGPVPYGIARGMGSLSFIFANIVGGIMIARFGPGAVAAWVIGSLALYGLSVWFGLKPDPIPAHAEDAPPVSHAIKQLLRQKRYWLLIGACGLIQSSHAFYYSFSNLTWAAQGIDAGTVGLLWGVAVGAEVAFLFLLPLVERRVSAEALIILAALGGIVRWSCLAFAPVGFVLWPLQLLHACSFAAAHVGAMRLILRDAPERAYALAQTLYSGIATGALMGFATLLSGWLYDHAGPAGYWVMTAMAAGAFIFALALACSKSRATAAIVLSEPD